ncbi:hypothetical protein GUITHDRAFT_164330 [Guillardia theta CCMP2712]|uniref:Uncharacterized protein n=2 Tax=Guillardia theta TaxID=55529 RepID=L1J0C2_GUITC|nr:hypothetical protein GUITHDRAFT_164330 [Guillardia theta CCMP2712]EKX41594.1 hypothetical protein GUITHDRAFT_164330 [Guillardia theta CCMP2712]|eukprot:XP_005828574.1 hypothetical protein GUITHDRAFT_164330 [Guillardia theta CCMP2712]
MAAQMAAVLLGLAMGCLLLGSGDAFMTGQPLLCQGRRSHALRARPVAPLCKASDEWEDFILETQENICRTAARADGKSSFITDRWDRGEGQGFGITRVLEDGNLWEKAACSVSVVKGKLSKERAMAMSSRGREAEAGQPYSAIACSLVFHSASPMVPTFRADVRHFQVVGGGGWYGGGADLTPYYLFPEDAKEFHSFYKNICDKHDPQAYGKFKKWCDDYFYIPARKEHRGVGGIFFDDLAQMSDSSDPLPFVKDVADGFMPSYLPIAERRRSTPFTDKQRNWQLLRRGRYLEFNLLYDRGVKFGLDGQGRTESIMVSAPPLIAWRYNVEPEEGSEEQKLVDVLREPIAWA